jgi:hypothetical protein
MRLGIFKPLHSLKVGIAIVISGFILAAVYITVLIIVRQEALQQVSRHNTAWEAAQAVAEFTRLQHRVAEFGLPVTRVDEDEVKLRYEILLSRVAVLKEGKVQAVVQRDPDLQNALVDLEKALAAVEPLIENLKSPGTIDQVLGILKPLESKLATLASVAEN